jgi:hexosaminidase
MRFAWILILAAGVCAAPLPLMPLPQNVVVSSGAMPIDSGFRIGVAGYSDSRLEGAIKRMANRIARQTGILQIADGVKPVGFEDSSATSSRQRAGRKAGGSPEGLAPRLVVECRERGNEFPTLGEDESYRLDVSATGGRLEAHTVTGTLRGLETFAQLIGPGKDGFEVPAVRIEDRPRFPWRGLMLDVTRHWMPVAVVERNLDAMAAVKLNVFHWHLSDDQGFRVESKRYPKLQQNGSDGHFYTQAEVREVVAYARDRGIRVIPEFDIPGHTTAWFAGYPELASVPGPYSIERHWGIFEPVMDPTREETYLFLDRLVGEMAALFPDPYFHIGGDEVVETHWKNSAAIQAFAREHQFASSHDLQAYFNRRVEKLVKKHGKIMIGWDEVLAPDLASDTVIQSWRGQVALAEAVAKGYRSVLSFGYYLDHLDAARLPYSNDPMGDGARKLTAEQASRVLGGEACMWSEYVTPETVDSRIWPTLAAIAERFWSVREVNDVESMYARLDRISQSLEWIGLEHLSNSRLMLDRLTGGHSSEPLRVLADASEALGIAGRRVARRYTSLVSLNRFVDAVPPESESVRRLERDVAAMSESPSAAAELRLTFAEWAESSIRLRPLLQDNSLVAELLPLAANLAQAGQIGLQALEYIEKGTPAPAAWVEQQNKELDRLEKPVAEVRLAAVRPVRQLLRQIRPQALANGNVRWGNEPQHNGSVTVWNWTLGLGEPMIALNQE